MEEIIKQSKLRYLECPKGHLHDGEQLNFICVDPVCKDSGLICSICRIEIHQKHKVMPLKIFLCEVASKMKSRQQLNSNIDELLSQLDSLNQSILYNLKEVVESLALTIKNFETECANTIKRIREKIISQAFMNEHMPKVIDSIVNSEYTDVEALRSECKKLVDSINYSEKKGIEIDIRPEKSIESFSVTEQDIIKNIQKASKQFIESIKKLEKSFEKTISATEVNVQFQFSQTFKSQTITITDSKTAVQGSNQNYENRFALLEPELSMEHPTRFAFQVKHIANWIGFGVCLKNVLEKKAYKFEYNNTGHGAYLISSNGYSWSHSSKEDNMANKSFVFSNDDIIICEFDYTKKLLTFKKQKTNNKFTLTLDFPENEKVVPCINLCNKGEKVEIVNNIDLSSEEL
ncbi:hypothetical protein ABPG74_015890 [Tetrahymena malaccensis]